MDKPPASAPEYVQQKYREYLAREAAAAKPPEAPPPPPPEPEPPVKKPEPEPPPPAEIPPPPPPDAPEYVKEKYREMVAREEAAAPPPPPEPLPFEPAPVPELSRKEYKEYKALPGEEQFQQQIDWGVVPVGSIYISETSYLPASTIAEMRETDPELHKILIDEGYEAYQAVIQKRQAEYEEWQAKVESEEIVHLYGETYMTREQLETIKAETPELFEILTDPARGYEAYLAKIGQIATDFEVTNTQLPDGQWINTEQLDSFKTTSPEIYEALTTSGFIAADKIVKDQQEAFATLGGYAVLQAPTGTGMPFEYLRKHFPVGYDIKRYLTDNPEVGEATLLTAGFTQAQIDEALKPIGALGIEYAGYTAGQAHVTSMREEGYIPTIEEYTALNPTMTAGELTTSYKEKYGDVKTARAEPGGVKWYPGGGSEWIYENLPTDLVTKPKGVDIPGGLGDIWYADRAEFLTTYYKEKGYDLGRDIMVDEQARADYLEATSAWDAYQAKFAPAISHDTYVAQYLVALQEQGIEPTEDMRIEASQAYFDTYGTGAATISQVTGMATRAGLPALRATYPEYKLEDITPLEWALTGINAALITAPIWVPPVTRLASGALQLTKPGRWVAQRLSPFVSDAAATKAIEAVINSSDDVVRARSMLTGLKPGTVGYNTVLKRLQEAASNYQMTSATLEGIVPRMAMTSAQLAQLQRITEVHATMMTLGRQLPLIEMGRLLGEAGYGGYMTGIDAPSYEVSPLTPPTVDPAAIPKLEYTGISGLARPSFGELTPQMFGVGTPGFSVIHAGEGTWFLTVPTKTAIKILAPLPVTSSLAREFAKAGRPLPEVVSWGGSGRPVAPSTATMTPEQLRKLKEAEPQIYQWWETTATGEIIPRWSTTPPPALLPHVKPTKVEAEIPSIAPIPTPTPLVSPTPLGVPSPTPASVPAPTPTPEPTASPEPIPTPEPTPTPTPTPTPVPTPTPTPVPPPRPTPTPTPIPTPTPVITLVMPFLPLPMSRVEKEEEEIDITPGKVFWKERDRWLIVSSPWKQTDVTVSDTAPPEARILEGTPQETLVFVGGIPWKSISIDYGDLDIYLDSQSRQIISEGRGAETDIGIRLPSTMEGISIPAVYEGMPEEEFVKVSGIMSVPMIAQALKGLPEPERERLISYLNPTGQRMVRTELSKAIIPEGVVEASAEVSPITAVEQVVETPATITLKPRKGRREQFTVEDLEGGVTFRQGLTWLVKLAPLEASKVYTTDAPPPGVYRLDVGKPRETVIALNQGKEPPAGEFTIPWGMFNIHYKDGLLTYPYSDKYKGPKGVVGSLAFEGQKKEPIVKALPAVKSVG